MRKGETTVDYSLALLYGEVAIMSLTVVYFLLHVLGNRHQGHKPWDFFQL